MLTLLNSFKNEFFNYKLLEHSFYKVHWNDGHLTREILADYVKQYYFIEKTFIECLYILSEHAEKIDNKKFKKILLENINDEIGNGDSQPHLNLLMDFASEFNITKEEINSIALNFETQILIENFKSICKNNLFAGIGVMFAYEHQIPDIAESKINGLKKFYEVNSEKSLAFFTVHQRADVWHTQQWEKLIKSFSQEQMIMFRNGFSMGMKSLNFFLDGMTRVSKLEFNCTVCQ